LNLKQDSNEPAQANNEFKEPAWKDTGVSPTWVTGPRRPAEPDSPAMRTTRGSTWMGAETAPCRPGETNTGLRPSLVVTGASAQMVGSLVTRQDQTTKELQQELARLDFGVSKTSRDLREGWRKIHIEKERYASTMAAIKTILEGLDPATTPRREYDAQCARVKELEHELQVVGESGKLYLHKARFLQEKLDQLVLDGLEDPTPAASLPHPHPAGLLMTIGGSNEYPLRMQEYHGMHETDSDEN
jgi:hypothetical protein